MTDSGFKLDGRCVSLRLGRMIRVVPRPSRTARLFKFTPARSLAVLRVRLAGREGFKFDFFQVLLRIAGIMIQVGMCLTRKTSSLIVNKTVKVQEIGVFLECRAARALPSSLPIKRLTDINFIQVSTINLVQPFSVTSKQHIMAVHRIIPSTEGGLIFFLVLIVLYAENSCFLIFGQNVEPNGKLKGKANITDIMKRTGTLKLSMHFYDRYYGRILEEFRDMQGVRILEIGADPGKSLMVSLVSCLRLLSQLRMPTEYFLLHADVG
jgi:hypothetical protein